ncbi:MAG: hypothetical protein NWE96_04315 [Candidatus Bathyarchaeota archaeon]|nr:hypothetical protein [Candidatus Bathyarchaeota archaeon]
MKQKRVSSPNRISTEEEVYAKAENIFFSELNLKMPKTRLLILLYLAQAKPANPNNPIELQNEKIYEKTHTTRTNALHHLDALLSEKFIQIVRQDEYKNRGSKLTYKVTTKGLVVAIIYHATPFYEIFKLKLPWNPQSEEGCDSAFYNPRKEPVKIEDLEPHCYYLKEIPVLIESNQELFSIRYNDLNDEQKEIAKRSAIFAAYDYADKRLPLFESVICNKGIPKGLLKASQRFPYLKEQIKQSQADPFKTEKHEAKELAPDDDFINLFLTQPILKKWENWHKWVDLIVGTPSLKRRLTSNLTEKVNFMVMKRNSLLTQINSIKQVINLINQW